MAWVSRDPGGLIGRSGELAQLRTLHANARLLTMLGPPGVGKTRLGLRLAGAVAGEYSDGVWFIDVASIPDPTMLPHVICRQIEVRFEPGQTALDALAAHLRTRNVLLILDTCERALEACTALARTLSDGCPRLHVLAISREPMNTSGDTIWRTPPLAVPTLSAGRNEATVVDSVQLMLARARQHDSRFSITRANWAPVAEICRSLGGLPLALELVAPHLSSRSTPSLPLAELRASDREHLLGTTLRWAYQQLPESARILLRRLALFGGSFDVSAARIVCADRQLPADSLKSRLDRLVASSLVVRDFERYHLLDSVREFALEQLKEAGEEDAVGARFLEYMLVLAERVAPESVDAEHAATLEREVDNIRAALIWGLQNAEPVQVLRLALAACSLWYFRGYYAEGCEWLERSLHMARSAAPQIRARAAAWLGQLLQFRGEYAAAERWLALAADLHRTSGDALGSAVTTGMLGQLVLMRGELERAKSLCSDAVERLAELRHPLQIASLLQLAVVSIELGDLDRAREIIRQCAAQHVDPNTMLGAWLRLLEGRVAAAAGDRGTARNHFAQAAQIGRELQEQTAILISLVEQGYVDLDQHSLRRARAAFLEAIELATQSSDRMQLARAVEGLAGSLVEDRPAAAVRLISAANRLRTLMGGTAWPGDRRRTREWLADAHGRMPPRDYAAAWKAGEAISIDEAIGVFRTQATNADFPAPRTRTFTVRERQIITLLADAATNEQIARQLAIRPSTARTHVEHVMAKLGLHKRTELVLWASQHASDDVKLGST